MRKFATACVIHFQTGQRTSDAIETIPSLGTILTHPSRLPQVPYSIHTRPCSRRNGIAVLGDRLLPLDLPRDALCAWVRAARSKCKHGRYAIPDVGEKGGASKVGSGHLSRKSSAMSPNGAVSSMTHRYGVPGRYLLWSTNTTRILVKLQ